MIIEYWEFLFPVVTVIICTIFWLLRGWGPNTYENKIPLYDIPKEISPIEAGLLLDNSIDDNEIAAQIIYCINQGLLKLEYNRKKDKKLKIKRNKKVGKLKETDINKKLIDSLFKDKQEINLVKLKEHKEGEDDHISYFDFKNAVSAKLSNKGLYKNNPRRIKQIYDKIGWGLIFIGLGIYIVGHMISFVPINSFSIIISGIIVLVFKQFITAKTKRGVELKNNILKFKEYLEVAEQDRLNFHYDPEKNPESFSRLLPYAMIFQQEQEWSEIVQTKTDEEKFLEEFVYRT
jgi:hypothetical protein